MPAQGTVTLMLTPGFSFAKPVLYLSTDTNSPLTATLEGATYAPGLEDIQGGGDDSLFSPVERIFVFVNGPTGKENPQRQGLDSAISDGGSPLNVLGGIPTVATDYSPIWDLNPSVWTQKAVDMGYRSRMTEEFSVLGMVEKGWITGLDGKNSARLAWWSTAPSSTVSSDPRRAWGALWRSPILMAKGMDDTRVPDPAAQASFRRCDEAEPSRRWRLSPWGCCLR